MKVLDQSLLSVTPQGWALVAQKCGNCGTIAYPKKRVCPECFGEDLVDWELSRRGTLHTYARTDLGAPRLGSPYYIAFVDLPEKIRLFGQVIVKEDESLTIGQSMDVVVDALWREESGEDVVCYKFRPAEEEMPL